MVGNDDLHRQNVDIYQVTVIMVIVGHLYLYDGFSHICFSLPISTDHCLILISQHLLCDTRIEALFRNLYDC